jgi:hypothetical protein
MKILFITLFFSFCSTQLFCQCDLKIEIFVKNYMSAINYNYIIDDEIILIEKLQISNSPKVIFRKRLNHDELYRICETIDQVNYYKLDSSYVVQMLDGFYWTVKICKNYVEKQVVIENSLMPEINTLFKCINNYIGKRKYYIRLTN